MRSINEKRALLKEQFRAFMETAETIMVQLEVDATTNQTCSLTSVATIQRIVADHFRLPHSVMSSRIRSSGYVAPRHIAMVLSRELTEHSLSDIGECFMRDHGTVSHATKSITNRVQTEPEFSETLQLLRARCEEALAQAGMPLFSAAI